MLADGSDGTTTDDSRTHAGVVGTAEMTEVAEGGLEDHERTKNVQHTGRR